jgi:hypothetical protein
MKPFVLYTRQVDNGTHVADDVQRGASLNEIVQFLYRRIGVDRSKVESKIPLKSTRSWRGLLLNRVATAPKGFARHTVGFEEYARTAPLETFSEDGASACCQLPNLPRLRYKRKRLEFAKGAGRRAVHVAYVLEEEEA